MVFVVRHVLRAAPFGAAFERDVLHSNRALDTCFGVRNREERVGGDRRSVNDLLMVR